MQPTDTETLFRKLASHFEQQLPFAVYNKPNAKKLIGVFQHDDALHVIKDFTEKGFAFVSFDNENQVVIPHDSSEVLVAEFESVAITPISEKVDESTDEKAKSDFTQLVGQGIDAIKKGDFGKVVLSRKEVFSYPEFELTKVFQRMLNAYPTAFTYCFFYPKTGLWLGGFSEQLIRVNHKNLHTMAVAGTQLYREHQTAIWETKEIAEQQFVTDFITESLQDYVSETKISEPYTMKAGNLIHIKTDIEAALNDVSNLKEVISILHPTPAVCGFPKENAKKFILDNESYDREFYAGFLGELNADVEKKENNTDLYVNLRCMKVDVKTVNIFVGCGITKDSVPEKEWIETVNKSKTMKQILY